MMVLVVIRLFMGPATPARNKDVGGGFLICELLFSFHRHAAVFGEPLKAQPYYGMLL